MPKIILICQHCGKEYTEHSSRAERSKYCSRKCQWANHAPVALKCQYCGKEYFKSPSQAKRSKYCSVTCKDADLRGQILQPRLTIQCPVCGKYFQTVNNSHAKKTCSKKCANKLRAEALRQYNQPIPGSHTKVRCDNCGRIFTKWTYRLKERNFCSRACGYEWFSKQAPYIYKTCEICGKKIRVLQSLLTLRPNSGRFCSKECLDKGNALRMLGAGNPNWQGGTCPYYGPDWARTSAKIMRRDSYKCKICGSTDTIEVHHLKPIRDFVDPITNITDYESANQESNLITVCRSCHIKIEPRGHSSREDTQLPLPM